MMLNDLLKKSGIVHEIAPDVEVSGLAYDSRLVKNGHLFFAIQGANSDGHNFMNEVSNQGACAAVVERQTPCRLPVIQVESVLVALSKIANQFFEQPSMKIPVIGITGTNGKTTVTYLIEEILKSMGKSCGVLGTVNYRLGKDIRPAPNTTPMSLDIQSFLSLALERKAEAVVMEVSSHALELNRVDDVRFSVGVFTNLTQDHLDFHGSMENYFQAKRKLFIRPDAPKAVINIDDEFGVRLAEEIKGALSFGQNNQARLRASEVTCDLSGNRFKLQSPSGKVFDISNNLLGMHNVSNCLAAAGALLEHGLAEEDIVSGLNRKITVPGRLERVESGQEFVVVVDYAHTHDALAQVLTTLRNTGPKRLLCVFGAGGNRDKTKRPKMGDVAVQLADEVFVTSDNPRFEDPADIVKDIEAGIEKTGKKNYHIILDREEAIRMALSKAKPGDAVLIAGKGHETYQIFGNKKVHFSDLEMARKLLRS
ncbi:MAG: UDP-N-acetylmuramoyl-L-alanyl-D-glutamate--2,6-diaminopimelate ligase [Elusimicrobia bacterium]|nr:UDP-N-acetylmuramoyl-L-alanyl-D-glutamate--2,6-diaminopimelate ligase [Elusimicrobiota bacterium]